MWRLGTEPIFFTRAKVPSTVEPSSSISFPFDEKFNEPMSLWEKLGVNQTKGAN